MPGYKEESEAEDGTNLDITPDIPLGDDDELPFGQDGDEIDASLIESDPDAMLGNKKAKAQPFSLQARRAIEDHLEQRRLRKELDYLYDDKFAQSEEPKK